MIVITGPGRCGTSFLASLYRSLGFDPKGRRWNAEANAGFEWGQCIKTNLEVAQALGPVPEPEPGPRSRIFRPLASLSGRLPDGSGKRVNMVLDALRYRRNTLDLVNWSELDDVVAHYGDRMRQLSSEVDVVKDPRFCWTLQAWLASGASISAVVLAVRPLGAMVESRVKAGMLSPKGREWAMNNFAFGTGLAMSAVIEHRVPLTVLRFPDFMDDPRDLYERLPLPEERSWESFQDAFHQVHDDSLVHDRS